MFGFKGTATRTGVRELDLEKANAMGNALLCFMLVPWTLCLLAYGGKPTFSASLPRLVFELHIFFPRIRSFLTWKDPASFSSTACKITCGLAGSGNPPKSTGYLCTPCYDTTLRALMILCCTKQGITGQTFACSHDSLLIMFGQSFLVWYSRRSFRVLNDKRRGRWEPNATDIGKRAPYMRH